MAERQRHYLNLFLVLVGMTAKGRKGSSLAQLRLVLKMIDASWTDNFTQGLSSGEGVIFAVRDPQEKPVHDKKTHKVRMEVVDLGVEDKRLTVIEPEFASTLKVMGREGNTLSAVVRQAWGSGLLKTMTRTPLTASEAHISVIAHVVADELRRYLTATEMGNGFGNRFLWMLVRRSKSLPFGGRLTAENLKAFNAHLRTALDFARVPRGLSLDEEGREIWARVYVAGDILEDLGS